MKKLICLFLILVMCVPFMASCTKIDPSNLTFSQATRVSALKEYDGQTVSIMGYMSSVSPVSSEFVYLMNLPYQSCPFCVPNTSQLSNTMAIYAPEGKELKYTDSLIRVTGTLEFAPEGEVFIDRYKYTYEYRIINATYEEVNTAELGEKYVLWQQLASSGVMADVYDMYDYLNYLCRWTEYSIGGKYDSPETALEFIKTEGADFNYGYQTGYFDKLIMRVKQVDAKAFSALIKNIENAKSLAEDALSDLENGKYKLIDAATGKYGLTNAQALQNRYTNLYREFDNWLASYEV